MVRHIALLVIFTAIKVIRKTNETYLNLHTCMLCWMIMCHQGMHSLCIEMVSLYTSRIFEGRFHSQYHYNNDLPSVTSIHNLKKIPWLHLEYVKKITLISDVHF